MELFAIVSVPFLGTVIGAAFVLLARGEMSSLLQKGLLGFASGVMVAASVWSLLLPSLDMSSALGAWAWAPACSGLAAGMLFLLLLDNLIPHLHLNSSEPEGVRSGLGRSSMLVLAVTLHNIPEGMAVGVVAAGAMSGDMGITLSGAVALAAGIAIQNVPEGAIISLPLRSEGCTRRRAFVYGALSGIVEPIAAVITILLIDSLLPMMPYLLGFAAGAMLYVVVEELIPEAQQGHHSNLGTLTFAVGFIVMMILDVALG
ncbi:zinc transporter ZupT [Alistipes sp.]|nr:zinc transporter ZupT [Alistipes sp.]